MGCNVSSMESEALPADKNDIMTPMKLDIQQRDLYQLVEATEESRNGSAMTKEAAETLSAHSYPLLNDVLENVNKSSRPNSSQSKKSNKSPLTTLPPKNKQEEKVITSTDSPKSRKYSASSRKSSAKSNKAKSSLENQNPLNSPTEIPVSHSIRNCSAPPKDSSGDLEVNGDKESSDTFTINEPDNVPQSQIEEKQPIPSTQKSPILETKSGFGGFGLVPEPQPGVKQDPQQEENLQNTAVVDDGEIRKTDSSSTEAGKSDAENGNKKFSSLPDIDKASPTKDKTSPELPENKTDESKATKDQTDPIADKPSIEENSEEKKHEPSSKDNEHRKILFPTNDNSKEHDKIDNSKPNPDATEVKEKTGTDDTEIKGTSNADPTNIDESVKNDVDVKKNEITFPGAGESKDKELTAVPLHSQILNKSSESSREQSTKSSVITLDDLLSDIESVEEVPCSLAASSAGLIFPRPPTSKKKNSAGASRDSKVNTPSPQSLKEGNNRKASIVDAEVKSNSSILGGSDTTAHPDLKRTDSQIVKNLRFNLIPDEIVGNNPDALNDNSIPSIENGNSESEMTKGRAVSEVDKQQLTASDTVKENLVAHHNVDNEGKESELINEVTEPGDNTTSASEEIKTATMEQETKTVVVSEGQNISVPLVDAVTHNVISDKDNVNEALEQQNSELIEINTTDPSNIVNNGANELSDSNKSSEMNSEQNLESHSTKDVTTEVHFKNEKNTNVIESRPNSVSLNLSDISSLNGVEIKHVKNLIGQNSSNSLEREVSGRDSAQPMLVGF